MKTLALSVTSPDIEFLQVARFVFVSIELFQ